MDNRQFYIYCPVCGDIGRTDVCDIGKVHCKHDGAQMRILRLPEAVRNAWKAQEEALQHLPFDEPPMEYDTLPFDDAGCL